MQRESVEKGRVSSRTGSLVLGLKAGRVSPGTLGYLLSLSIPTSEKLRTYSQIESELHEDLEDCFSGGGTYVCLFKTYTSTWNIVDTQ